ncbi:MULTISPECIES: hypothetical protein [unclassified Micromonospora]
MTSAAAPDVRLAAALLRDAIGDDPGGVFSAVPTLPPSPGPG